jgi:hypothetical protein
MSKDIREAAKEALEAIDALIAESRGVCGLHQNGDDALWESLTEGGQFEDWLLPIESLRKALDLPPNPDIKRLETALAKHHAHRDNHMKWRDEGRCLVCKEQIDYAQ